MLVVVVILFGDLTMVPNTAKAYDFLVVTINKQRANVWAT